MEPICRVSFREVLIARKGCLKLRGKMIVRESIRDSNKHVVELWQMCAQA